MKNLSAPSFVLKSDQVTGSLPWWSNVAAQLRDWLVQHQVLIPQAVVLLPSAKLLPLLRQAWRGPLPRITTLPGLAAELHQADTKNQGPSPSPAQLTMNLASDELLAQQMLMGFAWGRDLAGRDPQGLEQAARAVALTAQALAGAAAAHVPRGHFWQQVRAVLKSAGAAQSEQLLVRVAAEWAAQAPAPFTDILFEWRPSAWVVLSDVNELDPLTYAVIKQHSPHTPCAVFFTLAQAEGLASPPVAALASSGHPWGQVNLGSGLGVDLRGPTSLPSGEATLTLCEDFEDEAQCVAACVLQHRHGGLQPLALIAEDRLLIRRVSALLQRHEVDLCDEAGWKLSTTRAASVLHQFLRACEPQASSDDWLQWLADCPACAPGGPFEQAWMQLDSSCRQAGVNDVALMLKAARTWAEPVQALLSWAQEALALLTSSHQTHEKTPGRSQVFSSPSGGLAPSDRSGGAHEKTPGRSQVFSSPSGGLARSDRSGGALRHTCPAQTWLDALQTSLVHTGVWADWQADAAGQQLCAALFGVQDLRKMVLARRIDDTVARYEEEITTTPGRFCVSPGVDEGREAGTVSGKPPLAAFNSMRWSWNEFVVWVDRVLESQHFVPPPSATDSARAPVIVTTLAQAVLRPFAAVIFPGADARTLGGSLLPHPLLSLSQAQALGLTSSQQQREAQQQRFLHLLSAAPVLRFFRRCQDGKDPVAESPLLEALALRMARAGRVLHDLDRRMDFRVQRVHPITPAQPGWPVAADLLPSKLSAQAAEALRACPYRFFVQYVLRLREDDALSGVVQKRDYGDALHQVLMRFHQQRSKAQSAQVEAETLHQMVREIRREMNLDEAQWLPFAASFSRLVPRYVAWLHERDAQNAVWQRGEHEIRCQSDQHGLEIFGRIDRIDALPTAGKQAHITAMQVIDYKTGSAESLKQRLKNPQEDTQLAFYAALVAHDQTGAPVQAAYVLLDTPDAPELLEHRDVQNTAQYLMEGLSQDLQRLRAGHGMPPLGEGADCQFCAARGVCRRDDWMGSESDLVRLNLSKEASRGVDPYFP